MDPGANLLFLSSNNIASEAERLSVIKHVLHTHPTKRRKQIANVFCARQQQTPLFKALEMQNHRIAAVLIQAKANVNAVDIRLRTPLIHMLTAGKPSSIKQLTSTLSFLLSHNQLDLEARDASGKTALLHALSSGQREPVLQLTAAKANVNGVNGLTRVSPLYLACEKGNMSMSSILLETKANVAFSNPDSGDTCLVASVNHSHVNISRLLIEHKANVNTVSNDGITALTCAAYHADATSVFLLLSHKANVNHVASCGNFNALQMAATRCPCHPQVRNNSRVVHLLLDRKASVNHRDSYGNTALIMASKNDDIDSVRLLLLYRADPSITNHLGVTALHIAEDLDHKVVADLIVEHFRHKQREISFLREECHRLSERYSTLLGQHRRLGAHLDRILQDSPEGEDAECKTQEQQQQQQQSSPSI